MGRFYRISAAGAPGSLRLEAKNGFLRSIQTGRGRIIGRFGLFPLWRVRKSSGTLRGMRYKTVLLFGPPGSGKGTQGKIIAAIPGFFHSASGDIFRSLDLRSESGRIFHEYASKGELVPDEVTVSVWRQYMKGTEMTNQFHPHDEILVLDGIPRSVSQAKLLEGIIDVRAVIHLHCTDLNKMVERLRRRALKENRFDDANDEVIQRRLLTYDINTKPVLEYYPQELVHRVDATMSQIRVLCELLRILIPIKEEMDLERGEGHGGPTEPSPNPSQAAATAVAAKPIKIAAGRNGDGQVPAASSRARKTAKAR